MDIPTVYYVLKQLSCGCTRPAHPVGLHVIQQASPHSPDHDFLFRADPQLVLNAVNGVPNGYRTIALEQQQARCDF